MPSDLFRRENNRWVFAGPTPPSFQGYDKDQTKLLVDYMFQLTPEEQRRVAEPWVDRRPRLLPSHSVKPGASSSDPHRAAGTGGSR